MPIPPALVPHPHPTHACSERQLPLSHTPPSRHPSHFSAFLFPFFTAYIRPHTHYDLAIPSGLLLVVVPSPQLAFSATPPVLAHVLPSPLTRSFLKGQPLTLLPVPFRSTVPTNLARANRSFLHRFAVSAWNSPVDVNERTLARIHRTCSVAPTGPEVLLGSSRPAAVTSHNFRRLWWACGVSTLPHQR